MSEPFAIYQTAEPMSSDERAEWIRARCAAEPERGYARATFDPELSVLLLEIWRERPLFEDKPRFQLVST